MRSILRLATLLLFILFLVSTGYAQPDSIDHFVSEQMQKRGIPGLQLAIVKDGKIVKTGNYGLANVQDSIPVTDRSVFTINSITKAFTGVAILQLVETGKLSLFSPVSTYIRGLPAAWNNVTVMQLLSHSSGIPDIDTDLISLTSEENAWKKLVGMPMDFEPGERFLYNQANYLLLGRIIDTLSGMSFRDFIIKEQLLKVGMPKTISAGFGATKQLVPHAAGGYRYENGILCNMFFSMSPSLQTAAGMSSSAAEMAKWVIALQDNRLFKEKTTLDLLWTPAKLNNGKTAGFGSLLNGYAVGWPVISRSSHRAAAAVGGGRSAVFVYPDDKLSIVVLTNLAGGSPEEFIDEIAGFYFPDMKESSGFGLSPSLKQLRARLENTGYKQGVDEWKRLNRSEQSFSIEENELNSWGYKLIGQKRLQDALEIFKLNVYLYPGSANTYDSLGEAYAELGEVQLAINSYEKSLKLDPSNKNAEVQLSRLRSK